MCTRDDLAEFMRPVEAAAALGISTRTLNEWAKAGLIEHRETPGGHRRYPRAVIAALVAELARPKGDDLAGKGPCC